MNVFFRVILSFLFFSVLYNCFCYIYGRWLLTQGLDYVGHWYVANGMFWRRDIIKYCPYHGDEVCPAWNCPNYLTCANNGRKER